jgi:hypothetical protein
LYKRCLADARTAYDDNLTRGHVCEMFFEILLRPQLFEYGDKHLYL